MFSSDYQTAEVALIDSSRLLISLINGEVIVCDPSDFSIIDKTKLPAPVGNWVMKLIGSHIYVHDSGSGSFTLGALNLDTSV